MLFEKRKCLVIIGGINPGHKRSLYFWENVIGDFFQIKTVEVGKILRSNIIKADLLIIYTSLEGAEDEEIHEIYQFIKISGKVLLVLHEGCIYNKKLSYFKNLIGVRFTRHYDYSIQTIKRCGDHILLNKVSESFEIKDELYILDKKSYNINSDDRIFLKNEVYNTVVGYERKTKYKSLILFISLGHEEKDILECDDLIQIFKNLRILFQ